MLSFQVLVLGFAVRFFSLFLASLPQPFHKCLPSNFSSGIFHFRSTFFRPRPFRFQLLSLLFLPFLLFPSPPHSGFPGAALSAFASLAFPVLSDLVSRVFFPGCLYSAFCLFPFVPPGFAPTAVPPVLPLCFRFRAFSLSVAFFRPLRFGSDYSAFRSFFSLLPVFPCRRFLRCCPFAVRLPRFSSSVRPVAMPYFRFWYSAYCASFFRSLSRLTVATSAPQPSSFRFPASSPWLSL